MNFVTLTCPNCGGKLQITEDIDKFACTHCGNEHVVIRREGIVSIAPLTDELQKIKRGTDKTAAELAIVRLKYELQEVELKVNQLFDLSDMKNKLYLGMIKNGLQKMKKLSFLESSFVDYQKISDKLLDLNEDEIEQLIKILDPKGKQTKKPHIVKLRQIIILKQRKKTIVEQLYINQNIANS